MRLRHIILLILMLSVFSCRIFRLELEYIAVNDYSNIYLINTRGEIEYTIPLPAEMALDFYIDKDIIYFYGLDKKLHIYNWRNKKERDIISGPFYFKEKNYGPEVYLKITAWKNIVGFLITPEYFNSLGNTEELKDSYPLHEMLQDSRVGIYDVDKKQFCLVPIDKGYYENLMLLKNKLIISNGGLNIYHVNNRRKEYIYHPTIKNKYNESYQTILLGTYFNKIYYAFTDYFEKNKRIYKIMCWDIDKKTDKILYDTKNTKTGEDIYGIVRSPSRISKDKKKLIWIDQNNNVIIYDFSKKRKESIYDGKNIFYLNIQFYYCRSPK